MYLLWLTRENPTQLLKILTHLAIVFTALSSLLTPYRPPTALDSRLRVDRPARVLGLYFWLSVLNWPTSFVLFFQSRRFLQAQIFVWSSRQNRQRKVFYTLRRRFKDAGYNFAGNPQHTETHPLTSIYLYIYTHTWMLNIVPYSSLFYLSYLFTINYITKKIWNRHNYLHAIYHIIQEEPSLLIQQKHKKGRLLHPVARTTAMY